MRPPTILVLWEDHYFTTLASVLEKFAKTLHPGVPMSLLHRAVEGYSNFPGFLEENWQEWRTRGLEEMFESKSVDYVLCIADADRAHECSKTIVPFHLGQDSSHWLESANQDWTESLRNKVTMEPERIFGRFLRWNRESVVIACYDQSEVMEALQKPDIPRRTLDSFWQHCQPVPQHIDDCDFANHYMTPTRCLEQMTRHLGHIRLKKNSEAVETALSLFPTPIPRSLQERLPDFVQFGHLLCELSALPF